MSHSACWCEWVILVTLHVREKNKQENKQEEMEEVFSFICPCFFLVPSENFHLGGGGIVKIHLVGEETHNQK